MFLMNLCAVGIVLTSWIYLSLLKPFF